MLYEPLLLDNACVFLFYIYCGFETICIVKSAIENKINF